MVLWVCPGLMTSILDAKFYLESVPKESRLVLIKRFEARIRIQGLKARNGADGAPLNLQLQVVLFVNDGEASKGLPFVVLP